MYEGKQDDGDEQGASAEQHALACREAGGEVAELIDRLPGAGGVTHAMALELELGDFLIGADNFVAHLQHEIEGERGALDRQGGRVHVLTVAGKRR